MPNYTQLLETAAASFTVTNVSAALGTIIGGAFIHDLYQRYKNYIRPAEATADFLNAGGISGMSENPDLNIDQHLETLRQINELRNQRQDATRANLSPLGWFFSRYLREGHSDIDEIIAKNIRSIVSGRDAVTDEEFEFALQQAIMGATRTRGSLTRLARFIGSPIYRLIG